MPFGAADDSEQSSRSKKKDLERILNEGPPRSTQPQPILSIQNVCHAEQTPRVGRTYHRKHPQLQPQPGRFTRPPYKPQFYQQNYRSLLESRPSKQEGHGLDPTTSQRRQQDPVDADDYYERKVETSTIKPRLSLPPPPLGEKKKYSAQNLVQASVVLEQVQHSQQNHGSQRHLSHEVPGELPIQEWEGRSPLRQPLHSVKTHLQESETHWCQIEPEERRKSGLRPSLRSPSVKSKRSSVNIIVQSNKPKLQKRSHFEKTEDRSDDHTERATAPPTEDEGQVVLLSVVHFWINQVECQLMERSSYQLKIGYHSLSLLQDTKILFQAEPSTLRYNDMDDYFTLEIDVTPESELGLYHKHFAKDNAFNSLSFLVKLKQRARTFVHKTMHKISCLLDIEPVLLHSKLTTLSSSDLSLKHRKEGVGDLSPDKREKRKGKMAAADNEPILIDDSPSNSSLVNYQLDVGGAQVDDSSNRRSRRSSSRMSSSRSEFSSSAFYERKDLFAYPFEGPASICINSEDKHRLTAGEFLNDSLIDFYLRYLLETSMPETLRRTVHLFSSFFYSKLTTKDAGFDRIKSWTSKVDVFEKDYIIIPVNEKLHWYLVLVCYPKRMLVRETGASTSKEIEMNAQESPSIGSSNDDAMKKCFAIIFDSLSSRHPNVMKNLREFFAREARGRHQLEIDLNMFKLCYANVPRQPNHCDCGVFLLHYVEKFFQNSQSNFYRLTKEKAMVDWFPLGDIIVKRAVLWDLCEQLNREFIAYQENKRNDEKSEM